MITTDTKLLIKGRRCDAIYSILLENDAGELSFMSYIYLFTFSCALAEP